MMDNNSILPAARRVLLQQTWQGRKLVVVDEGGYRSLYFDNHMVQSRMIIDQPLRLLLSYSRHVLACLLFVANPQRILMIGLGGGSLAKFFLHTFPKCRMDVVESNPEMVNIARYYFNLPTDSRLHVLHMDGDTFVADHRENASRYDLILLDAYDHEGMSRSVYDSEFLNKINMLLSEPGVIAINVNRSQNKFYKNFVESVHRSFSKQAFQLPVQGSKNTIIFCNKHQELWSKPIQWQNLAWINHPEVDFGNYLQRMVPLKQPFWRRWMHFLTGHHPM